MANTPREFQQCRDAFDRGAEHLLLARERGGHRSTLKGGTSFGD